MAIIDHLEVSILVDGVPATEYDDEDEPQALNTISKYIEVTSGSQFTFKMAVLPGYQSGEEDGLTFHAYIDGAYTSGVVSRKERFDPLTGYSVILQSRFVGTGTDIEKLLFRFADLETRDITADDVASLNEKYSQLGCLEVKITRVRIFEYLEPKYRNMERNEKVPEKALKGRAIAVAAKLETAPVDGPPPPCRRTERFDNHMLATFKFHYRTRAALQSELIIPRSPSPLEIEERSVDELSPEEMREIIRRQREQAIKVEDEMPKLKRERPLSSVVASRPLKSSKTSEGKTIYHLDSDEEDISFSPRESAQRPVVIVDLN